MAFTTYEELAASVAANGDVLTVSMEDLRNAHGAGKLGVHVRAGISGRLRQMGLAHIPGELPNYYWDEIRIYKQGTPAGNLIEAVNEIGEQHDAVIRDATGTDAGALVQKIRELVCE